MDKILSFRKIHFENMENKKTKNWNFNVNPHSGEGGLIGNEESSIIAPLIKKLKNSDINISTD